MFRTPKRGKTNGERNEALCTFGGCNRGHLSVDAGVRQLVAPKNAL